VTDEDGMLMMSSTGQTVRINMNDLRVMGRNTQGVKLANLREGDYLVAVQKIEGQNDTSEEGENTFNSLEDSTSELNPLEPSEDDSLNNTTTDETE